MMKELLDLLANPLFWKIIIGYWTFSAFVGAMPSPDVLEAFVKNPVGQLLYRSLFAFMHGVSGNVNRAAIAFKVPGAQEDKQP